jgi:heme A synthase
MDLSHVAGYLFIIGLIAAVIAGLAVGFSANLTWQPWIVVIFLILGVVIGACMLTSKKLEEEVYIVVLVSLALLIASNFKVFAGLDTAINNLGTAIDYVVADIAWFSAAAMIVLAIRTLTRFHVSKIS